VLADDVDAARRGDDPARRASVNFGKLLGGFSGEFLQLVIGK
jgi:hypothetical protein